MGGYLAAGVKLGDAEALANALADTLRCEQQLIDANHLAQADHALDEVLAGLSGGNGRHVTSVQSECNVACMNCTTTATANWMNAPLGIVVSGRVRL